MNAKVNITNRAGATFPVRRMNFDFNDVPEYWMNGSAGLTHFMTALSALFPDGEKFLSIRFVQYATILQSKTTMHCKKISAFIGQEAMHTQEHVGFNASAQKYGHDVASLEQRTGKVIQTGRKIFAKLVKPFGMTQEMVDLTATTALEHFTATIASQLLRNPHIQALMTDDTMSTMWYWHAIEENEHKAVAYDVFEGIFGRDLKAYSLRNTALVVSMLAILLLSHILLLSFYKKMVN